MITIEPGQYGRYSACWGCTNTICPQSGCQRQKQASPLPSASLAVQMGVDPISRLADAINNLADALRTRDASES